jgi:hypothetical protein
LAASDAGRKNDKATRKAANLSLTTSSPASTNKGRTIELFVKPGETQDRAMAGLLTRGLVTNAATVVRFVQTECADLSLMDTARELREQGEAINRGDFAASERMLNAQAVTLNAIFVELARRAALNMGEHLGAMETYMRLALKAQSQCRSTFDALATMKNPPAVFARQANIAHGPQQVNNAAAPIASRAGETQPTPNELSGAGQ